MSLEKIAATTTINAIINKRKKGKNENSIKLWFKRRNQLGVYDNLLSEHHFKGDCKNYLRVAPDYFDELFELAEDDYL